MAVQCARSASSPAFDSRQIMKRFGAVALILLGMAAKADHVPTQQDEEDALTCHVIMWVTADGAVQLAQVAESSGSSVIDGMCLNGVIVRQFKSNNPAPSSSGRWAKLVYRLEPNRTGTESAGTYSPAITLNALTGARYP
jgi:hypothetical protein